MDKVKSVNFNVGFEEDDDDALCTNDNVQDTTNSAQTAPEPAPQSQTLNMPCADRVSTRENSFVIYSSRR